MEEFVLLFRMDITNKDAQPSKEQMDIEDTPIVNCLINK